MNTSTRACSLLALFAAGSLLLTSCQRERRTFRESPPAARLNSISMSPLKPGPQASQPGEGKNPLEENAYAVAEGERLFTWYNCVGCHSHGGGGMGPPLMDEIWIYGSQPENIFATIVEGRPNGMPSFRGKIPDYQVWELAAYVRSLSGLVRKDVAPGRSDHMSGRKSEASTRSEHPK